MLETGDETSVKTSQATLQEIVIQAPGTPACQCLVARATETLEIPLPHLNEGMNSD